MYYPMCQFFMQWLRQVDPLSPFMFHIVAEGPNCLMCVSMHNDLFEGYRLSDDVGNDEARKIHWVKWDKVCQSREKGGLGIHNLKVFNTALLGRWCWRLKVEREGLWFKVLCHKYDCVHGKVCGGLRKDSTWWRAIYLLA